MSFFSEASLAMIPSGYKTSKVYSAIPTSGDGDLTFSRSNDTATRVGPDGLIEKVRTNLVTYSNTFSNADWVVDQVTKTTGQTDPNGGTTAVLLTSTNTSSTYMYQTKAGLGCLSIYAKVGTETGDIATDYIATTSAAVSVGPVANVPRLDYLGSSCPRLLLEPQRTNLVHPHIGSSGDKGGGCCF
jgi:hypothetical protein